MAKEILAEKVPFKAALVRNQTILAFENVIIQRQVDLAQIAVTVSVYYPCDDIPGLYLVIGRNQPEDIFLRAEPFKCLIGPEPFRDGVADITRERITLPIHLFKRWRFLCREYTNGAGSKTRANVGPYRTDVSAL